MRKEDPQWVLVKLLLKEEKIWESATPETLRSITKGSLECIVMMAEKIQELEDRIVSLEMQRFQPMQDEVNKQAKKEKKRDQPEAR